jgi:tetratricopeptide (TPR) repeat protein
MIVPLASALIMTLACQSSSAPDRSRAEQLARAGRTVDALTLFERIVEQDPRDTEARLWIARLNLRLGRIEEAEAGFRSVVDEHPADVDARIGLGTVLTRKGASSDALAMLLDVERDAGENSDLFGALARAYRRAGDDRRALEYFRRAKALAPADPDLVSGFEDTVRAYGHAIAFEGFGQHDTSDNVASGSLALTVRAAPRLHVDVSARVQRRSGVSDATAGGGVRWRAGPATTVQFRAIGGHGNTTLPNADLSSDLVRYAGIFEVGGSFRWLSFASADVAAVSPMLSWDPGGRWRTDGRYTYSRSSFSASGQSSGDHSVMLRETWRGWRRVYVNAGYAYGIESFENLTADRLGSLGATTLFGGLRVTMPSITLLAVTWEHQWRSNSTTSDRFTVGIVQSFP